MSKSLLKSRAVLLIGILLLAFLLRLYKLGEIPSLHTDEADFAYNAYSILKTGKDQTGKFLPLGTSSTGDLRPAFYVYLSLIPIKIWGLTEFAVRFPALIFGTLSVLIMYFLAKDLFRNEKIALVSSFLMGVSFWHITLSREASEKVVAVFLVLLGFWLILKYFKSQKFFLLLFGFISFFISIHTYYAPRLFFIMFLPGVWWLFRKKLLPEQNLIFMIFMLVFISMTVFFTFFYGRSGERINQLLVFKHPYTIALLGEQISEDGTVENNVLLTRFFHNKPINFSFTLIQNYFEYFSPAFLFISGGQPPRVKVSGIGLLNMVELPFFILGVFFLLAEIIFKKKREYAIIVYWLLISPVAASFTFEEIPNVYRSLLMLIPICLFTAFGFIRVYQWFLKNKVTILFFTLCLVMYIWNLSFFLHQYFVHFEVHQPWYRNFAQKQLALFLKENASSYEKVFISKRYGGTDQIIRFYLRYDPVKYQEEGSPRDKDYQGFGNLVFVPEKCPFPQLIQKGLIEPHGSPTGSYLFVNSAECEKESSGKEISIIQWQDQQVAYLIVRDDKLPE